MTMNKFTHGIMVIDPLNTDDLDSENVSVVHFVGYWSEPKDWDAEANRLREELRTDPDEYYRPMIDRLLFYPATADCLKYYNDICEEDGCFTDEKVWKERMN